MTALEIKVWLRAVIAGLAALACALLAARPIQMLTNPRAGESDAAVSTPFENLPSTPELIQAGRDSFVMSCVECHGNDAHGDEGQGPDLHNLAISNARIATTIKHGVKGEMPAFAKKYDDAHVMQLLAYLRSLH